MKNKIVVIIQTRMGSSRLPGKVLRRIKDKTVLAHVVTRVNQSKLIDDIVIATTNKDEDDQIIDECNKIGVKYYRGSENNVLERYYEAAVKNKANIIVRITSDCPLIDPNILDDMLLFYLQNEYSIVTNGGNDIEQRTYPRGLDIEITSLKYLKEAYLLSDKGYEKEHVTPYIYARYSESVYYFRNKINYSKYRITLDTMEDFKLIEKIYDELYFGIHNFYMNEIIILLKNNPKMVKINEHIIQKEYNK